MKNNLALNFNLSIVIVDPLCSNLLLCEETKQREYKFSLEVLSAFALFTPVLFHIFYVKTAGFPVGHKKAC